MKRFPIYKETAALCIVILDLIMVMVFWISLISVKPLVDLTEDDIMAKNLLAQDFTVMLTNRQFTDRMTDVVPIHWEWAESVLKKSRRRYFNSGSNLFDENQDRIVNVHLGLNSYKFLGTFKTLAESLHAKKTMGRKHTLAKDERSR